jgi:streptogramin lyase
MERVETARLAPTPGLGDPSSDDNNSRMREITSLLLMLGCFAGMLCMLMLAGCGVAAVSDATSTVAATSATQIGNIQGSNFGGHAPIKGSHVFVMQIGSPTTGQGGYGAAVSSLLSSSYASASYPTAKDTNQYVPNTKVANSLLNPTYNDYYVTTDATGQFNISGDYTCTAGYPVYLYAAGGITAGTTNNQAIANMAMLGVCPSSGSTNFSYLNYVYMNEVSTVAMAYTMAPFAIDSLHIGTSTTNLIGLQNAALNAAVLYNIQGGPVGGATGQGDTHIANSVNPNNVAGMVPQATINTLANIIASCVDSANTSVGRAYLDVSSESAACSGLFAAAASDGNTVTPNLLVPTYPTMPIDTASALINIAHYPAGINSFPTFFAVDSANPSTLFNLPTGNVPFTPALSKAPTDWTIALTYKNLPTPSQVAIDAKGDAYIGTYSGTAGYITELSPQGAINAVSLASVGNMGGLAISPSNIVWASSNSGNSVYRFSSTLGTSGSYTSPYTSSPTVLAVDGSGNVYVANNSLYYQYFYLSEFNSSGTVIYNSYNYEFSNANGIALATNGNVWVTANNNSFSLYSNPSTGNGSGLFNGGFNGTGGLALDYQGQAWVAGKQIANEFLVRSTVGGLITSYGVNTYDYTSIGGLSNPLGIAVDGSNVNNSNTFNVWVTNPISNTVSEVNSSSTTSTLSPSVGYQSGSGAFNNPTSIAVDNSGNVWVTNQGNSTVAEIIGSTTPVSTPLSAMKPGVAP